MLQFAEESVPEEGCKHDIYPQFRNENWPRLENQKEGKVV